MTNLILPQWLLIKRLFPYVPIDTSPKYRPIRHLSAGEEESLKFAAAQLLEPKLAEGSPVKEKALDCRNSLFPLTRLWQFPFLNSLIDFVFPYLPIYVSIHGTILVALLKCLRIVSNKPSFG